MMSIRPRLTPAIADVRRAVRDALEAAALEPGELVLVALSGGADSLSLAAATAFEAPRADLRAGAVIVDHGLQHDSADVAARAGDKATVLGLEPVVVERVEVDSTPAGGGPEAAARNARYQALSNAAVMTGASRVLLGHTLNDQAETVLLGLARGSGASSLAGMIADSGLYLRPLLGIARDKTVQFCADSGLETWNDPHNSDPSYARVRARREVLPVLERELGPGVTAALARTADQLREDAEALDALARELVAGAIGRSNTTNINRADVAMEAPVLAAAFPAIRQRVIRFIAESEFGVSLSRSQTLAVAALVTDWRGQKELHLPGIRVVRKDGRLIFSAAVGG